MKIQANISWKRQPKEIFLDGKYKRTHQWSFDGGVTLAASSSPAFVPIPMSDPTLIDPEEAFLASIASCHMLFFLSIAAKMKIGVQTYEDHPFAIMGENESGRKAVLFITLNPKLSFDSGLEVSSDTIDRIHRLAHENCFLANSVRTNVIIQSNNP